MLPVNCDVFYTASDGGGGSKMAISLRRAAAHTNSRSNCSASALEIHSLVRPVPQWIMVWGLLFVILSVLFFLQVLFGNIQPNIGLLVLALRNYLWFWPIAFIMANILTKDSFEKILKIILISTVPVSILVTLQYYSPVDAFINRSTSDDAVIFTVVKDVVRPYGPFSFTLGQSTYTVLAFSVLLCSLHISKLILSSKLKVVSAASVALMTVHGGSRGTIVGVGIVGLFYVAASLLASKRLRQGVRLAFLIMAALATVALSTYLFPTTFVNMNERQEAASQSEGSPLLRGADILLGFVDVLPIATPLGQGIGYGTNVGSAFISGGGASFALAEGELSRILLEFGVFFGLLIILVRFAIAVYFLVRAAASARKGNLVPMTLVGVIIPLILAGQITAQNTLVSVFWWVLGLFLADTDRWYSGDDRITPSRFFRVRSVLYRSRVSTRIWA